MDDGGLTAALDRAERALARVERAVSERKPVSGRDDALRAKVAEAVAELEQMIREAAD